MTVAPVQRASITVGSRILRPACVSVQIKSRMT